MAIRPAGDGLRTLSVDELQPPLRALLDAIISVLTSRRSWSASPALYPPTASAMRITCSWKSGTPRVRWRMRSSLGCG